jgi:predicted permease
MKSWMLAARALARRPGFALTVFGLLSLGIAANTALFSVVDTVLVKPLPYPDPDRLVTVYEANSAKSQTTSLVAPPRIEEWDRMSQSFAAISGQYFENVTDTAAGEPERLTGLRVAPRFFEVYGAPALLGRTPAAIEEREGGPRVAVISHGLWTRRYGQDPAVLERRLVLGGERYSIVGVMPKNFASAAIDVWIPAQMPAFLMRQREARFYNGVARMKRGITVEQAQQDLARVQLALAEQYPATDKGWSVLVRDLKAARLGDSGKPLVLLFGAVALLLTITVTNVASLVLARLDDRQREIAIRFSLGGARAQVVGALMREIAILAAAGAAAGWAGAALSLRVLAKLFAATPRIAELQMDWRALVFAAGLSGASALAFGLFPALRATSGRRVGTFLRAGRGSTGRRRVLQPALVTGQIALTMTLLAGSGLLLRSFQNLTRVDLGFSAANTLLFHVGARWDEDRTRIGRMQETIVAELNRLPGVEAAGIVNFLPIAGATLRFPVTLEGAAATDETARMPAGSRMVSTGYLKALRAPLLAGAWCSELRLDWKGQTGVMVNRRFAEVYGQGGNVVGRRLRFGTAPESDEILGVIGDMREDGLDAPAYPYVYHCARAGSWPDPEYVVRASGDPRSLLAAVREVVRRIEPDRAIFGVRTMDEAIDGALDRPRSSAGVLAGFALTAMLLAAVGLSSLHAHFGHTRRQEIGVRSALGATPQGIVGGLVGSAGRLIAAGIVAGVSLTFAGQRLVKSLLFGVGPLDGASLAGAAALLAIVALAAALLPARRAAAIDPAESMRE